MQSKKLTLFADKLLIRIANKLCRLFGHRWHYKDYGNHIQADGNKYDFKASRNCSRCNQHAYFYTEWIVEAKSKTDFQGDYFSLKEIKINNTIYS